MSTSEHMTERLSAEMDGELSQDESATLAADRDLDRNTISLDRGLRRADEAFRRAIREDGDIPVSLTVVTTINKAFARRRSEARRRVILRSALPISASLLIVIGGGLWFESRVSERFSERRIETARLIDSAVQSALESAKSGTEVAFGSANDVAVGHVVPIRTYRSTSNHWCREFEEHVIIDGKPFARVGIACREADGNWYRVETRYRGGDPLEWDGGI